MLLDGERTDVLYKRLNYYVKTGKLLNIRRGVYAKDNYKPEELACILYTPTYISLDYVLQRAGVVFQFDSTITNISYLHREVTICDQLIRYFQVKEEILSNTAGILRNKNNVNIASPERALLDKLYLVGDSYFDNLHSIDASLIHQLVPIYGSKKLEKTVKQLFSNDKHQ